MLGLICIVRMLSFILHTGFFIFREIYKNVHLAPEEQYIHMLGKTGGAIFINYTKLSQKIHTVKTKSFYYQVEKEAFSV